MFAILCIFGILTGGLYDLRRISQVQKIWIDHGNRINDETRFYNSQFGGSSRTQYAIQFTKDEDGNVITKDAMQELDRFFQKTLAITVEVRAENNLSPLTNMTLQDLCVEVSTPYLALAPFLQIAVNFWPGYYAVATPQQLGLTVQQLTQKSVGLWRFACTRGTVLDCFKEGGYGYKFPTPPAAFMAKYPLGLLSNSSIPLPTKDQADLWVLFNAAMAVASNPYLDQVYYNAHAAFQSAFRSQAAGTPIVIPPRSARLSVYDPAVTDEDIRRAIPFEGCRNFGNTLIQRALVIADKGLQTEVVAGEPLYEDYSVVEGGYTAITRARYLRSVFYINNIKNTRLKFIRNQNYAGLNLTDARKVKDLIERWEDEWLDEMVGRDDFEDKGFRQEVKRNTPRKMTINAERSLSDVIGDGTTADTDLTVGSYILIGGYVAIVFVIYHDAVKSRILLSWTGLFLICFSVFAALGLSGYVKSPLTGVSLRVLPFLGLGLGLQDFFLVLQYYKIEEEKQARHGVGSKGHRAILGESMSTAGPAITFTSVCNLVAFGMGVTIPIATVRTFALQMVFVVITNWISNVAAFPAAIVIDKWRQDSQRMDVFFCFRTKRREPSIVPLEMAKSEDGTPAEPNELKYERAFSEKTPASGHHVDAFTSKVYVPFLFSKMGFIIVFILGAALLGLGIAGCTKTGKGILIGEAAPKSYARKGITLSLSEFGSYSNSIVLREFPFKDYQTEIKDALVAMDDSYGVIRGIAQRSAFFKILDNLGLVHGFMCQVGARQDFNFIAVTNNGGVTINRAAFPYSGVPVMPFSEMPVFWNTTLKQSATNPCDPAFLNRLAAFPVAGDTYTIPSRFFTDYFLMYLQTVGVSEQDRYLNGLEPIAGLCSGRNVSAAAQPCILVDFQSGEVQMISKGLFKPKKAIRAIKSQRDVLKGTNLPASIKDSDNESYPFGYIYIIFSQYLRIDSYFIFAVTISIAVLFVIMLLYTFDFRVSFLILCILIKTVVEVYGFMYWSDLTLNGFSVMNLVTTSGLVIEFTIFPGFAYIVSGRAGLSGKEQAIDAIERTFNPVFNAAVTTFLGIVLLAASPFKLFSSYFFNMYAQMTLYGLFNSLAVFPILLYVTSPGFWRSSSVAPSAKPAVESPESVM